VLTVFFSEDLVIARELWPPWPLVSHIVARESCPLWLLVSRRRKVVVGGGGRRGCGLGGRGAGGRSLRSPKRGRGRAP
jgi:hypothetical protein